VSASSKLRRRLRTATAAAIGAATLVVYLTIIVMEGDNAFFEVFPWALLMAIPPVVAVASIPVDDSRTARNLLIGAIALWSVLGFVSIFSIGMGFVLAAVVASLEIGRLSTEKTI
jgi:hypothetical protein